MKKLKQLVARIQDSAIYKILMSKALERIVSFTLGVLAIAGVSIIALPAAIVGIVTVGIGSLIDTYSLRTTRRLVKEQKLLVKNRNAISQQNFILMQSPKLANVLEGMLLKPDRGNQKSVTERYIKDNSKAKTNLYDYGKAILKNITNALFTVGKAVSAGNILSTLIAVAKAGRSIYSERSSNSSISAKRNEFYIAIDRERNKADTPGYNNLRELRIKVREQRIQALALRKMSNDGKYHNLSDEDIKKEFHKAKEEIEAKEEKIGDQRHPVVKAFRSFGKNFLRAHNPFSKYNDMSKLKVKEESEITKSMTNIRAAELPWDREQELKLQKLKSLQQHESSFQATKKLGLATKVKNIKQKVSSNSNEEGEAKTNNGGRKSTHSLNLGKMG